MWTGLCVFVRVAALLSRLPAFSSSGTPKSAVVLSALAITAVLAPALEPAPEPDGLYGLVFGIAVEVALGLLLGAGVDLAFAAIATGAEIAATQMGFANGTLFDPLQEASSDALGTLASWIAALLFLSLGLHLTCLEALAAGFGRFPPGQPFRPGEGLLQLVEAGGDAVVVGVQLAGPVLVLVFTINLLTAILGRLAPRIHAFFAVGTTLTGLLGLAMFALALPWTVEIHVALLRRAVAAVGAF